MSNLEFQKCPEAEKIPSAADAAPYTKGMVEATGSQACRTEAGSEQSTFAFAFGGGGIGPGFIGGLGGGGGGASMKSTSNTLGCEQISAIAQRNYQTAQKIKCIINQKQQNTNVSAAAINNINFESTDGGIYLNCGDQGLKIKQGIRLKIVNTQQFSDETIQDITETVELAAKQNIKQLQESKVGFGATPQGQKVLQETFNKIDSKDIKAQVQQAVVESNTTIDAKNNVQIKSKKDINISGKECDINQDISLDILAQTIINSVMKNTFTEFFKASSEATSESTQKSEAEGMPDLFKSIGMIIGGIVALIVVLIIIYMVFKFSGSAKPLPPRGQPMITPSSSQSSITLTPPVIKPKIPQGSVRTTKLSNIIKEGSK